MAPARPAADEYPAASFGPPRKTRIRPLPVGARPPEATVTRRDPGSGFSVDAVTVPALAARSCSRWPSAKKTGRRWRRCPCAPGLPPAAAHQAGGLPACPPARRAVPCVGEHAGAAPGTLCSARRHLRPRHSRQSSSRPQPLFIVNLLESRPAPLERRSNAAGRPDCSGTPSIAQERPQQCGFPNHRSPIARALRQSPGRAAERRSNAASQPLKPDGAAGRRYTAGRPAHSRSGQGRPVCERRSPTVSRRTASPAQSGLHPGHRGPSGRCAGPISPALTALSARSKEARSVTADRCPLDDTAGQAGFLRRAPGIPGR